MSGKSNYYELLGVDPAADLEALGGAYLRAIRELRASGTDEARAALLKEAFDVLSDPARRAEYDAGRRPPESFAFRAVQEVPLRLETERSRFNPIRFLLTLIAALMAIGLMLQVSVMFGAYKRVNEATGGDVPKAVADKAYLQEIYQTYGIRAASREEAELLLADMKRKEAEAREAAAQERNREDQERAQRRFEEESRRLGAQVSDDLRRAEAEARRAQEEEIRRKEEKERAEREAERRKREAEIARVMGRGSYSSDNE